MKNTEHNKNCPARLSRVGGAAVECPHGYDSCPICDRCTCEDQTQMNYKGNTMNTEKDSTAKNVKLTAKVNQLNSEIQRLKVILARDQRCNHVNVNRGTCILPLGHPGKGHIYGYESILGLLNL